MATRINFFSLPHAFIPNSIAIRKRPKTHIFCSKNNTGDTEFASSFAAEVAKRNTRLAKKEEAMKKGKGLLFTELCQYLSMEEEQVKKRWGKMNEEERWVMAKEFVDKWGVGFHPLSARSVKGMLDEYLDEENPPSNSSPSDFFPGIKKFMGF